MSEAQNFTPQQIQQMMQEQGMSQNEENMQDFADQVAHQIQNEQEHQYQQNDLHHMQNQLVQQSEDGVAKNTKKSFLKRVPVNLRDPLIVAVIFLLVNQPMVINQFARYLPNVRSNGNLSTQGLLILALVAGVIYYVSKMLIK